MTDEATAAMLKILDEVRASIIAGKVHACVVVVHGEDDRVSIMHCEELGHRVKLAEACMMAGDQVLGDLAAYEPEQQKPRKVLNG